MTLKSDLGSANIGDQSITEFLHSLNTKADELALIDSSMSDDDFTICVINGLSPKFWDIVAYIRAQPNSIPFSNLLDMLIAQERFINRLDNADSNLVVSANNAQSQNNSRSKSSTHNSRNRAGGGFQKGKPNNNRYSNQQNNDPHVSVCQLCQAPGHRLSHAFVCRLWLMSHGRLDPIQTRMLG